MRAFVSVSEMLQIDRATIEKRKISDFDLMQEVAEAMAAKLRRRYPKSAFIILCGPGNNGGDGYSLARILHEQGLETAVVPVLPPQSTSCRRASEAVRKLVLTIDNVIHRDADSLVWVDAIFGLKGTHELSDSLSALLKKLNTKKRSAKVSLDTPTGLNSELSMLHPQTFKADLTLTVGFPKLAFLQEQVREVLGWVEIIEATFVSPSTKPEVRLLESADFALPERALTGHKKSRGSVGVLGPLKGSPGAGFMASEAAARAGSGYVSLYLSKPLKTLKIEQASFVLKSRWSMKDLASESALVMGCGGKPKAVDLKALKNLSGLVVDASSLSEVTKKDLQTWRAMGPSLILTPHLGEAAQILKTTTAAIARDRLKALEDLVALTGQSVYLKGAPGLLKFSSRLEGEFAHETFSTLDANAQLSTAGSGDILSGILAGCLAQLPQNFAQACFSALLIQKELGRCLPGSEGSIATDQLACFAQAFERLRKNAHA